jgi:flavin-dependent dehydrogenase
MFFEKMAAMSSTYDSIIIGGGPGGSTVATHLARRGRRVIVLEKAKFPRFHVGESLLPYSLPVMDRLGVLEKVRRAGFQEKYGAYFWNETTGGIRPVVFADAIDSAQPMAYQVKRADFDNLLLEHSIEKGAEVRQETTVLEVLFEKGRAVGVAAAGPDGVRYELRASVVVDASGQDAFLSRKMKMRSFDPKLKRAGLFAHFENVPRPEGRTAGDILLPVEDDVWYWIIPFGDGTSSVGAVFDPSKAAIPGETIEARYERLVGRSKRMRELLGPGRRVGKVVGIADYSSSSSSFGGDGWVMVGDAASFLDPVFSTGVFLAMTMGERAADAIDRALGKKGRVDASDLKGYERKTRQMVARFRRFVHAFYDPIFFEAFCSKEPFDKIRAAITTVLAGGVERVPLTTRFWTSFIFLGVGIDRFRRKLGLGPKPAEKAEEAA